MIDEQNIRPDYFFKYFTATCDNDELQELLDEKGKDGWRLHTCEPYVIMGVEGIGSLKYAVVMDIGPIMFEDVQEGTPTEESEGIPMV